MTAQQFRRDPKASVKHAEERKAEREELYEEEGTNFCHTVHTVEGTAKPSNIAEDARGPLGRVLIPSNKDGMPYSSSLPPVGTQERRDIQWREQQERDRIAEALEKNKKRTKKQIAADKALDEHIERSRSYGGQR